MAIVYRGVRFAGYNKPKRTPKHKTKSHAVLAKQGSKVKLIRFGQQGVRGQVRSQRQLLSAQEEDRFGRVTQRIYAKVV